jgi:hypothetical protein
MFPFTIPAYETPHYTESAHDFRQAFIKAKPEGVSWYAYDVEVKSPTLVEFTTWGMRCTARGGIGAKGISFEAVVTPDVTRDAMWRHARGLAEQRRMVERMQTEEEIVAAYAAEILQGAAASQ